MYSVVLRYQGINMPEVSGDFHRGPSAIDAVRNPEVRAARLRLLEAYKTEEIGAVTSETIVPNMIAAVHQSTAITKTPERDALGADVSKLAFSDDPDGEPQT